MGNDDKAAALAAAPQPNANTQATLLAATAPIAAASVMPVQVTINTPVAHDNWGDEFNQKITWLSNQKEQTAELHLNPPQLGPMDVVLKVSGDQATALFTSPHAAVREAVEQALPRLREMMAESGIMLGNATVSDQAPRGRQGDNDNKPSGSRTTTGRISETSRPVSQNVRVSPISRHNGIVDTFA
jgi:flagellar hook-length control protein FliK